MIADQWCETSWRAQPGSFVGLMTLYESNFVRLGWLVDDLRDVKEQRVSRVGADCDLHLTPLELARYTSVFRLTYEFEFAGFSVIHNSPSCTPDSSVNWISAGHGT